MEFKEEKRELVLEVAENVLEDGCEGADPLPLPFNPTRFYILLLIIISFTYFYNLVIFNRIFSNFTYEYKIL
jgi:hypothetical protein